MRRLGAIGVPTRIVVGKDDILTPPGFGRTLAKAIRRARLSVLPGGHGLFIEQADLFNRTTIRFLKGIRSK